MRSVAYFAAGLAGVLHIVFFVMESLLWERPQVHRLFGVTSAEEAATTAFALYNLGFYNLGLGAGALAGIGLDIADRPSGIPVMVVACLIMVLAAFVLAAANPRLYRGALLQGAPPAAALLAVALA